MLTKRASRLLLAAAIAVTAGTAATVASAVGATASPSSSAPWSQRPEHARPARGGAHGRSACGFVASMPADRFKGIPVFNAAEAAQPYTVKSAHPGPDHRSDAHLRRPAPPSRSGSWRRGYFNRTHCHRLTTQGIYVLQCGDPTGTGSGGPGYSFNDENLAGATYPAGTVAMANAGPNTNGSQFFFVWKNTTLPPLHPVRHGDRRHERAGRRSPRPATTSRTAPATATRTCTPDSGSCRSSRSSEQIPGTAA